MVALVLLPGLDGTGLLFADFVAALGPEVKIIVASYPSESSIDYAELEPIARSFLPKDQPYFLLGESFSGPLAISIAASRPPGLLGLILCCSFARSPRPLLSVFRSLLCLVPVALLPRALLSFFVLGRFSTPELRRSMAETLARVSPSALRARVRAVLSVDRRAALSRVEVPVLYLRASRDRLVPESASRSVVAFAPACKVTEFAAPHFLLQVAAPQAAMTVREFMRIGRAV